MRLEMTQVEWKNEWLLINKTKAEIRLKLSSNSVMKQGITQKNSSKWVNNMVQSPSHRLSDMIDYAINKGNFISEIKRKEQNTQINKNLF